MNQESRTTFTVQYRVPDRTIGLTNWHRWDVCDSQENAEDIANSLRGYEVRIVVTTTAIIGYQELVP